MNDTGADEVEVKDVPYDQIEPAIRELCRAINEFPGVVTSGSCQGHLDGHRPGEPWQVYFSCNGLASLEGYASIEFLVWLQSEARAAGFKDLFVGVCAPPPYLNGVCESMYFFYECTEGHPDDLAKLIRELRDELFVTPQQVEAEEAARS
jgi:hypothetical protein